VSPSTLCSPTSTTRGPVPAYRSLIPEGAGTHTRLALAGARLVTSRLPGAAPVRLLPAQVALVDVLAAEHPGRVPVWDRVAVCVPRRSGKTTTLLALALGRCAAWPGYRAVYTAQTGIKSRDRFYDLYKAVAAAAGAITGWRARESRGEERIELANGSVLRFGPPRPDTFRSDAVDLAIVDEAQEHDLQAGGELLAAILPTMDTRPLSQLIVAGTATTDRDRLLHTALERGRRQDGWGIVEYAADPEADDLEDPAVWARVHPGLGEGLTTLPKIRGNRADLGPVLFAAEYLGVWPVAHTTSGITQAWAGAGTEHRDRPPTFVLAFDVDPDGSHGAVVAAWRPTPTGPAHVELVEAGPGTAWLAPLLTRLGGRGRPIGYDASGRGALDVADQLAAVRPRLDLHGLDTAGYITACAAFARHVIDGRLTHPRQPQLSDAVSIAVRRRIADSGWGWGRRASAGDISPLVAATVALRVLDTSRPPAKPRMRART
jgi:hypothetical protein